jgi:hypothetical protein
LARAGVSLERYAPILADWDKIIFEFWHLEQADGAAFEREIGGCGHCSGTTTAHGHMERRIHCLISFLCFVARQAGLGFEEVFNLGFDCDGKRPGAAASAGLEPAVKSQAAFCLSRRVSSCT